jgi:hypothetical protein
MRVRVLEEFATPTNPFVNVSSHRRAILWDMDGYTSSAIMRRRRENATARGRRIG